jgi:hypothetical protein
MSNATPARTSVTAKTPHTTPITSTFFAEGFT